MLVARLEDGYTSTLIRGVAGFAESVEADLLVYLIGPRETIVPEQGTYGIVQPELMDGIVLSGGLAYYGSHAQDELADFRDRCFSARGGPVPLVGTSLWLEGVRSIVPSSYEGMREAVEHLIDGHGCRRIGFIGGPEHSSEAQDRYRAYADALQGRGLEADPKWQAIGEFTREAGEAAVMKLFTGLGNSQTRAEPPPVDALVCASDLIAIGAIHALQEHGLRVPEDLAVIGFDDSEEAGRASVPLTTVRQPVYDIGYQAAAILWQMIQNGSPTLVEATPTGDRDEELVIPTRMVVRRSCGCLPEHVTQAVLAPALPASAPRDLSTSSTTLVMFEELRAEVVAEIVAQARLSLGRAFSGTDVIVDACGEETSSRDDTAVPRALLDAFWAELRVPPSRPGDSGFVRTLATLMRHDDPERGLWDWHAMISILRRRVILLLDDRSLAIRAEDLLQQARAFIGEALTQVEAHRHGQVEDRAAQIGALTDSIANFAVTGTADDLRSALARMEEELPALSVHAHCVVRLLQAGAPNVSVDIDQAGPHPDARTAPSTLVRLERAYAFEVAPDGRGGADAHRVPGEGSVVPLSELLPEAAWNALAARRRTWIILPLTLSDQGLGVSLFHGDFEFPDTYLRLRQALITVMQRSELVRAQAEARREAESAMQRAEESLRDALIAQQRYVSEAWLDPALDSGSMGSGALRGYERTPEGEGRTDSAWLPTMTQAVTTGQTVIERDEEGETLALPLVLYGQEVIGTLGFWRPLTGPGGEPSSWSDGQIRLVENVVNQMAQALETQRLLSDSHRRAARLAAAAEVSSAATSMTNLDRLLTEAVALIKDRFALYYAGLFLVDRGRTWAVLTAGTGEAGAVMLDRGHRLDVGGDSMIGRCVASGEAQIVSDTSSITPDSEVLWRPNPLLPGTRSELALPLVSRGTVIGAMTIQDEHPGAFTEGDITTLQTMADQLANAIENARLLEEMERTLRELQLATGRYTEETWRKFIRERTSPLGYRYRLVDVTAAGEPRPEVVAAMEQDAVVMVGGTPMLASERPAEGAPPPAEPSATGVSVPIRLRNQVLGALNLRFEGDTVAPEVLQMIEQVSERLAVSLESARLLEESRRTAERERLVGDVSRRIRQSLEVDEVLQRSVREIRDAMDLFRVSVRLAPRSDEE